MAAFSFTAPRFTDEMLEEERKKLTDEERAEIEAECYGLKQPGGNETPDMIRTGLAEFEKCLAAIENKKAYREALRRCPKLIDTESPPIRFLRAEKFKAKAAAKRFVCYWELRKKIFGSEKAFFPMRLEGGALEAADVEMIRNSPEIYMTLPEPDEHGRGLMYSNKSAFDFKKYNRMVVTRSLWYVLQVATENEDHQRNGFVVIALMKMTHLGQADRRQFVLAFKTAQAMPFAWKAAHICQPPSFFSILWPVIAFIMGKSKRQRCFVHKQSKHAMLAELETDFGIPRSRIPRSLGGTLNFKIEDWIEARLAIEQQRNYS